MVSDPNHVPDLYLQHAPAGDGLWACTCGETLFSGYRSVREQQYGLHLADVHERLVAEAVKAALFQAAEEMRPPSSHYTDYWDGDAVRMIGYEESPNDHTPKTWLLRRAESLTPKES